ncbi:MAG: RagB/SusD family nutrient uptake outer membrane protein [Bacteroidales bacterium]|nr:RagB/SusD family nutrient uptake outer membrane protein [Bacteroidales bacterium]MCF8389345.1 RagB/SusD family nutrient uptake outer membrane protein [Bacteroidales bacterium]
MKNFKLNIKALRPIESKKIRNTVKVIMFLLSGIFLFSCESFFDPSQELIIKENDFPKDWHEYRAAELGLYALQQKLVDQIVILGELRADLVEVTEYADNDLLEIYNYSYSKGNKYTSPYNFYQLIAACNNLARKIEVNYPQVLIQRESGFDNYDRLYGEVLCMRAWTYFNAVKIYGEIPYIWPSLTSFSEIEEYISTPKTFYDVHDIIYGQDGVNNDTISIDTLTLDRAYLDMGAVIDTFTRELTQKVNVVGVEHFITNDDISWYVTVWNIDAYHCLLGEMYLYDLNLGEAERYFYKILYQPVPQGNSGNIKYGLDGRFANESWVTILTGLDEYEHIFTLEFNKANQQQNSLQKLFSSVPPNLYMLKPSKVAIDKWETIWKSAQIIRDDLNPTTTYVEDPGVPGDMFRGNLSSYAYYRNGEYLKDIDVAQMLEYKRIGNFRDADNFMADIDTVVYKYTIGKDTYDHDANFSIYKAAGIHLYMSEIYAYWLADGNNLSLIRSTNILNTGTYRSIGSLRGVRGRVGFGSGSAAIRVDLNVIYEHDPITNEIIDYVDYKNNLADKQEYLINQIIEERARELAFEGNRFYDLMRVAKQLGKNSYLADKVAAKFSGDKAEQVWQFLMNEENWYIPLD